MLLKCPVGQQEGHTGSTKTTPCTANRAPKGARSTYCSPRIDSTSSNFTTLALGVSDRAFAALVPWQQVCFGDTGTMGQNGAALAPFFRVAVPFCPVLWVSVAPCSHDSCSTAHLPHPRGGSPGASLCFSAGGRSLGGVSLKCWWVISPSIS